MVAGNADQQNTDFQSHSDTLQAHSGHSRNTILNQTMLPTYLNIMLILRSTVVVQGGKGETFFNGSILSKLAKLCSSITLRQKSSLITIVLIVCHIQRKPANKLFGYIRSTLENSGSTLGHIWSTFSILDKLLVFGVLLIYWISCQYIMACRE